MKTKPVIGGLVAILIAQVAVSQERNRNYPPEFPEAKSEVYKTAGDIELKLFVFEPPDHKATDPRPAIVFFFGGGFASGSPAQFHQHCRYFASRGLVAITADYRVRNRHETTPADSVQDGKDAMRYVRANAKRLAIDPDRIVASGGSAGGLVAACVGVIVDLDKTADETAVSYIPDAMVLFNPAIMGKSSMNRTNPDGSPRFPKEIMPYHHIRRRLPPCVMFFGTDDRLMAGAQEFQEAARANGNRCELLTWKGVGHGFFNLGRNDNHEFLATLKATDRFLASLGYLAGSPTTEQFLQELSESAPRSK